MASVYAGLSQLQERGLIDIGESIDKRETVFVISSESKRRKADSILSDLKSVKLTGKSLHYVMSDFEERITSRLNKTLPDSKVQQSGRDDLPNIIISCDNKFHGVDLYPGYQWHTAQADRASGKLMRLGATLTFRSLHGVILGKPEGEPEPDSHFSSLQYLRHYEYVGKELSTRFNVIIVPEIDIFALLPEDEELDRIITTKIAKPIAARCNEWNS